MFGSRSVDPSQPDTEPSERQQLALVAASGLLTMLAVAFILLAPDHTSTTSLVLFAVAVGIGSVGVGWTMHPFLEG